MRTERNVEDGPSQALLHALVESAPDALVVVGPDGRIRLVNRQAERMFGFTRAELLGQTVENLIPRRLAARHPGHRDAFFQDPRVRPMGAGLDLLGLRKDGTEFPVEISLSPIKSEGGLLVSSAIRDITDRKRAEARLARTAAELQAANQELEAFSYTVSHDLRAPLRSMAGFAQILLEDHGAQLTSEARHDVDMIVDSAREMGQLLDDLLAFSRLDKRPLAVQGVDVAALARTVADEARPQAEGRDVRIQVGPMPGCQADPILLKQVLVNLVGNAVKYTRTRKAASIEVGWTEDHGGAYFVRDNGVGFDMQHAARLFGVFQRLHRAEDYEGTGVGLAIVRRIVTRHGGRVWARAAPDQGATFFFTVPGGPHGR